VTGPPGPLVVRGGEVLDERGRRRADVLVVDGVVRDVGPDVGRAPGSATVLDAGGCVVAPGLVDLHTHLREPGNEEAETVETGGRAAALGGYTAVVAMPNTDPPIDSAAVAREVLALGRHAPVEVAVAGAITVGRAGERLAPMAELAALGIRLFTDDGTGVQDGSLMRRALDYAKGLGVVLAQHAEDRQLSAGGVMHEGAWSSRLGLPGVPAAAEEAMVARDVALVGLTGAPLHLLHLSTAGSVAIVRRAKAEGLPVTAEVAPHHLALTDASCAGYDPVFKVSPPLRTEADAAALRAALMDGTVDAIATDHAPHLPELKDVPFDEAPPGMLGLETALAVAVAVVGLERAFAAMSWLPARIAGMAPRHGGPVAVGAAANLCVLDPAARWTVDPAALASRSRNTPFGGWELTGRVRHTVLGGEAVVVDGEARR
jgi:dihydroorotase